MTFISLKRRFNGLFVGALLGATLTSFQASAQASAEEILANVQNLYSGRETSISNLRMIRDGLDRIIAEYPTSDLSVSILLQEPVGGIDIAALDQRLSQLSHDVTEADVYGPMQACLYRELKKPLSQVFVVELEIDGEGQILGMPQLRMPKTLDSTSRREFLSLVSAFDDCDPFSSNLIGETIEIELNPDRELKLKFKQTSDGSIDTVEPQQVRSSGDIRPQPPKEDEAALLLSRNAIREIQARLLLAGHDPRGVDGILGKGSRGAIRGFQAQQGLPETGLLSKRFLELLQSETSSSYPDWVAKQKAANAKRKRKKTRTAKSRLPRGWWRDRSGKYCRKVQFGLTMCRPYPP